MENKAVSETNEGMELTAVHNDVCWFFKYSIEKDDKISS